MASLISTGMYCWSLRKLWLELYCQGNYCHFKSTQGSGAVRGSHGGSEGFCSPSFKNTHSSQPCGGILKPVGGLCDLVPQWGIWITHLKEHRPNKPWRLEMNQVHTASLSGYTFLCSLNINISNQQYLWQLVKYLPHPFSSALSSQSSSPSQTQTWCIQRPLGQVK